MFCRRPAGCRSGRAPRRGSESQPSGLRCAFQSRRAARARGENANDRSKRAASSPENPRAAELDKTFLRTGSFLRASRHGATSPPAGSMECAVNCAVSTLKRHVFPCFEDARSCDEKRRKSLGRRPLNCNRMERSGRRRNIRNCTVTAEVAGSSPVVPAIFSKHLQRTRKNMGPFGSNQPPKHSVHRTFFRTERRMRSSALNY